MILVAVNNGMVVNKFPLADVPSGSQFVQVANDAKVNLGDLYDGKNFSPNPNQADVMAFKQKQKDIIAKLMTVADDVSFNSLLQSLDAQFNPPKG